MDEGNNKTVYIVLALVAVAMFLFMRRSTSPQVVQLGGATASDSADRAAELQAAGSVAGALVQFASAKAQGQNELALAQISANRDVTVAHEEGASQTALAQVAASNNALIAQYGLQLETARIQSSERVANTQAAAQERINNSNNKHDTTTSLISTGGKILTGVLGALL